MIIYIDRNPKTFLFNFKKIFQIFAINNAYYFFLIYNINMGL